MVDTPAAQVNANVNVNASDEGDAAADQSAVGVPSRQLSRAEQVRARHLRTRSWGGLINRLSGCTRLLTRLWVQL